MPPISNLSTRALLIQGELIKPSHHVSSGNVWKVWKEATRGTNNGIWDHKWYPQDSNEPNTQSWGIHYLRAWGWVFLDAGTFEIVQRYRRRHDAKA